MSYPVMLNLKGRRVVFVGGGRETEIKVRALVEAGARVLLISPFEHPVSGLEWLRRSYVEGDLEGAWLAFAHTPDADTHRAVFAEAERRGIWCNAVDDPPHCSFTMPAVHRQGELVVSVSTGGRAPALAARLRERLAGELGTEYAAFLDLCPEVRQEVAQGYASFSERREVWYRIVDSPVLGLLREGRMDEARQAIDQAING